jgi:GTPase KRas protein
MYNVFDTEGKALAKHYGCQFLETSAKQRIRIDETFYGIVREIRRVNEEKEKKLYPYNDLEKESLVGCCISNRGCIIL